MIHLLAVVLMYSYILPASCPVCFKDSLMSLAYAGGEPPPHLADTGLYKDWNTKQLNASVLSYEPQYALWSDGAEKQRWISIPASNQSSGAASGSLVINTSDIDHWIFPIGTKIWKEFSFQNPTNNTKQRVETRFVEKTAADTWQFASYHWSADETEAVLVGSAGMPDVFPLAGGKAHSIPSRNDCARCHLQRMGDPVLGFSALQLSDDREDSKSRTGLTYADLIQMNLISDRPAEQPKIYSSSILGRRAMGYLHANCGNCHNPEGSAGFTGLYFKHFITGTQSEKDEAVEQTAVGRMSGYFHIPGEPLTYRIQAGKPEKSAVWYMMHIRTAGKMPPIGSELVDEAGLSLVSDWITQMN